MMPSDSFGKPSWYVVQTRPRQEFRALENLQNQNYRCFLPTLKVERIRRGKAQTCIEPLFSRYLFICLDTVASNWGPLRSTRGVSQLVAFGGRFATLSDACIQALQEGSQGCTQLLFEPGEAVRIASGPFVGLEGIYQMPNGEARAMVLVDLLSRPQSLELDVSLLRKAA